MNKDLKLGIIAALENRPSTSFSAEEVNEAAVKAIMAECGLTENSTSRELDELDNEELNKEND